MGNHSAKSIKPKLLIVEDENSISNSLKKLFNILQIDAVYAENGHEGVRIIEEDHHFDLFLLDINLPGINGLDLAQRVRMNKSNQKIIFMTRFVDQKFPEEFNDIKVLFKPFTFGEACKIVSETL